MALTITSVAEGTTLTLELDGRLGTLETREFDSAFDEGRLRPSRRRRGGRQHEFPSRMGRRFL